MKWKEILGKKKAQLLSLKQEEAKKEKEKEQAKRKKTEEFSTSTNKDLIDIYLVQDFERINKKYRVFDTAGQIFT